MAAIRSAKTTRTRIEKDSLGTLEVPVDAYYGVQTARAVDNFPISGLYAGSKAFGDGALVEAFVQIKKAAAIVNCELGMLDKPRRDALTAACDHVLAGN